MHAEDDSALHEESPGRSPQKSNGQLSAHIEIKDDQSESTSPLRWISNVAGLQEDAEKEDFDSKVRCVSCPELHLPVQMHCYSGN